MPARDGEFTKLTEDEIYNRLEDNLESRLDTTAEPGDLITKQLRAEATTLAQNQEEALERVYYASYLEDATGKELDKLVDIIGLTRLDASPATGTVSLMRSTPPTQDYTIPQGTKVQTGGSEPHEFVLTEQTKLPYIDGWETDDLRNWVGDESSFSVVNSSQMTGDHALEVPATDGVEIRVDGGSYGIGTTFDAAIRPANGDAVTDFRFGYQDSSNYHLARVNAATGELTLKTFENGSEISTSSSSVAIPTGTTSHVEIEWSLYGNNVLKLFKTKEKKDLLGDVYLDQSPLWETGNLTIRSNDSLSTVLVDEVSGTTVTANIRALEGGVETNLGPHSINALATGVSGVEEVTNEVPTGDTSFKNTDFSPFKPGKDRETDEQLRQRAFDNTSIGGAATLNAIKTEIQRVDGFQSMTVYQNKTENAVNGLPEHSFEVTVHGGSDEDIGKALFRSSAIDSQDVGGVHGTAASYDVNPDVTDDVVTMNWSRPTEVSVNVSLDLIVSDDYVGNENIRSLVVDYIGGTDIDGSFTAGLDVGEDIYVSVLKNHLVSPDETGVWEVDSITLDSTGNGSDDTTTTTNGAEILAIAKSELAQANATDASITITTTTK